MKKEDLKKLGDFLVALSVIAVVLSAVGSLGYDLWLASTQWLIVATVFAVYAIYAKLS